MDDREITPFGRRSPPSQWRTAVATRAPGGALADWDEVIYADQEEDEEQGAKLLEYWRIIYKHKWVIAAALAIGLAVGLGATLLTRPIYTAGATLEIDRESSNVVGVQDVQPANQFAQDQEFFQTQYGLLKARSLAERVAQALGLATDDKFLRAMGALGRSQKAPLDLAARQRAVVGLLENGMGVSPTRDSHLVQITFNSPSPGLSAQIANAFAENFITSNLERRFQASSYARQFLEQHIAELKAKLEDSERQLVAYATQQQIIQVSPAGEAGANAAPAQSLNTANLSALDAALTAAKANLIQAQQRWRAAQAAPELAAPEVLADPTTQALRQQKATLTAQYNNQLKLYKPSYPDMVQLKAQIAEVDQELKTSSDTIRGSLQTQYKAAQQQVDALQGQVNQLKSSVLDERNRSIQYNILQREVDTNRTLYDGLLQRYKEIGVAGGVTANNISIVDRALAPSHPSQPKPLRNLALAGVGGLGLGVMLAFLLEALDQAIRRPADIESKLGLPVLGAIPLLEKGIPPIEALEDVRSAFSEAYFSIRSVLGFSTKDGVPKVISITSARPEEGKSTTAFALAQGFSRLGMRILLIDLDLRNPSQHKIVGADNRRGASSLLTGALRLDDVIQRTNWEGLFVVPSGPLPPSPAELLTGPRLRAVMAEASSLYDIVIVDGPPVMGLADAPLISSVATGAILTIEAGRTTRAQAQAAVRRLRQANAHILGAILTKFDPRGQGAGYGYGYGYSYEYDYDYGKSKTSTAKLDHTPRLMDEDQRKTPPAA